MVKGVFVILDGAADELCSALGDKTPLEFAKTPNLDFIAKKSFIDNCFTVQEGVIPQSSDAVVSLFGCNPKDAPRGSLEALGSGMKLTKGDLAFRCNFATIDNLKDGNLIDRRAGRTLSTKEAKILARAVNENVKLPFKFHFMATNQHRGVLVFSGGFSAKISDVDPAYGHNGGVNKNVFKVIFSKSLDGKDDSKLAAELVNSFARKSYEILVKHSINLDRAKNGLFPANFVLCRGAGNEIPRFKKLPGKWIALGYMPLEIGIARALKMDLRQFNYPKMRNMDIYSNLYKGLKKAIKNAIKMLKKNRENYDYFYVHFKETDIPGHDGKPKEKVKMIELLDKRFFSFLRKFVIENEVKLIVTADHVTSCRKREHDSGAVPVLFYSPEHTGKERWHRLIEEEGLKGRKIIGIELLEKTLFRK